MAIVKLLLFFIRYRERAAGQIFFIRFLRIAFLLITIFSQVLNTPHVNSVIILIFLTGELFDRILFYLDYDPVNIRKLMLVQLNNEKNEKKRG
jgi:hypothetical protein